MNAINRNQRIEEVSQSEEQFRLLFENNPLPIWIFDTGSLAILAVNDAAVRMYGYSREEFRNMTIHDIHLPDDVPDLRRYMQGQGTPYLRPDVWKHRKKSGEVIDVEMIGREILFDGKRARFVAAIDVTARIQAEDLLKETRNLLQDVLATLPIGVWIMDSKGTVIIGNPASKQIWGGDLYAGRDENSDYKAWRVDSGKRIEPHERASLRALRGESVLNETIEIESFDGVRKTILNSAVPLRDSRGNITGAIVVNQDITERRRQEEELKRIHAILERQATTDTLTGIFNRLKFNEALELETREAIRYKHPLSLIIFDIDHFKHINDTYGHLTGDSILREIVKLVLRNVRKADIFARWGGEEFIILSHNNTLQDAFQLAEKIRREIEKTRFSCPCRITCSFGLAQFKDRDTIGAFIKRADEALYRAKERGRNRVEAE